MGKAATTELDEVRITVGVDTHADVHGVLCHRGVSLVPANFVPVRVSAIEVCPPR